MTVTAEAKTTTTAPQPQTTPTPDKRELTIERLRTAWQAARVDLSKLSVQKVDKTWIVKVAEDWPAVHIGAGGGIELPGIRSYAKAFEAAVQAKDLLAKQSERDRKKQEQAAKPPIEKKAAPAPAEQKPTAKKESMTARKQRADRELEAKLK